MQKKLKIMVFFGISLIVISSPIIFFFQFYPIQHDNLGEILYPNPIWNGTLSDMIVEGDDTVHFVFSTVGQIMDIDICYSKLDFRKKKVEFILRYDGASSYIYHQVKIGLDTEKTPNIYLFSTNGYFYEEGDVLQIQNKEWVEHSSFANLPYNLSIVARGPILNWYFTQTNKMNIAYIYIPPSAVIDETTPFITTPVIYDEENEQATFLHEISSDIESYETFRPGDFKKTEQGIALMWERSISYEYFFPCLAINWSDGWQFYELGKEELTVRPLAIIPNDDILDIFYYNPGFTTNISKIFVTRLYNSTYNTTEEIASFDGHLVFYQDGISSFSESEYVLIYIRRPYLPSVQSDLFLGKYDGSNFQEFQLTNTTDISEYNAHCDISENYFHYAWTNYLYEGTSNYDRVKAQIFYNRMTNSELRDLFSNLSLHSIPSKNNNKATAEKTTPFKFNDLEIMMIVIALKTLRSRRKYRKEL